MSEEKDTYDTYTWQEKLEAEEKKVAERYLDDGKGGSTCKKCGATIMCLIQSHPIILRDGPHTSLIIRHHPPFCPNCEEQPEPDNRPIEVPRGTEVKIVSPGFE